MMKQGVLGAAVFGLQMGERYLEAFERNSQTRIPRNL